MSGVAAPRIHDTGEGPVLLLLHAFPLDASQWDHQVAALSDRYRCLRPDMWGCGLSPPPPAGAASLDDYAGSVLAAIEALDVDRFAVVGLSMGGYIAMALLRIAPQRVTAAVLSNTRASADTEQAREDRLRMASAFEREDDVERLFDPTVQRLLGTHARSEPHIIDPLCARIRRCTPAGIAFAQRAMAARPDSSAVLRDLRAPALCIGGEDDQVTPSGDVQAMAQLIDGARLVTLTCGHLSNLELPHEFSAEVGAFLDAAPATRR